MEWCGAQLWSGKQEAACFSGVPPAEIMEETA